MREHDLAGMVLDEKYRLERKIGEGGMGAVYQGVQMMVDRPVAVKVLHASLASHEKLMQRFEVEAKAIGRMNHPNCVTLYDFGFSKALGAFYMVMEYLDGTPMQALLGGSLGTQEIIDIARQIALALDHSHHHHILHRDLKPENVMITTMTDGTMLVKVLDFGIARIFQAGDDALGDDALYEGRASGGGNATREHNRLTQAGEIFGTPAYISPEQARGDKDLPFSSDLYSLGIMLYELIQGDLPFWGETPIDTIMQHINTPVPPIDRLDIPQSLKQITLDLMAKRPERRPQTGKEVADRLAEIDPQGPSFPKTISSSAAPYHSEAVLVPSLDDIAPPRSGGSEWDTMVDTMVKTQALPPAGVGNSPGIYARGSARDFGAQQAFETPLDLSTPSTPSKTIVFSILGLIILSLGVFAVFAFGKAGSDASEKVQGEAITQKSQQAVKPGLEDQALQVQQDVLRQGEPKAQVPEDSALQKAPPDRVEQLEVSEESPSSEAASKPERVQQPFEEEEEDAAPQKKKNPRKKAPVKKPPKPEKTQFESLSL